MFAKQMVIEEQRVVVNYTTYKSKYIAPAESFKFFLVSKDVHDEVFDFIGSHKAERGGMLGSDKDGVIRHFEPDLKGRTDAAAYDPDLEHMNGIIKLWKENGIDFCGFIHSHPRGILRPSAYDKWYSGEILNCFKRLEQLWIPIVQTIPDAGGFELLPFAAVPGRIDRKQCTIVRKEYKITPAKTKAVKSSAGPEENEQIPVCKGKTEEKKEEK